MSGYKYAIGIDIGGTKIASGLVDLYSGRIVGKKIIPTLKERKTSEVISDLKGLVLYQQQKAVEFGIDVNNVGLAFPELVNNSGKIMSKYNFDLSDLSPNDFDIENVVFESDVRAAGRAEATFGSGRMYESFVYISIGTGLSYSLYINGVPWKGANGYAIHFASNKMSLPCLKCNKQIELIPELFISGSGLLSSWRQIYGEDYSGGVPALLASASGYAGKERAFIDKASSVMGSLIAQMINMLDPDAVVIGGGLGMAGGIYHEKIVSFTREGIWAKECKELPILLASQGESAGIIGAALACGK